MVPNNSNKTMTLPMIAPNPTTASSSLAVPVQVGGAPTTTKKSIPPPLAAVAANKNNNSNNNKPINKFLTKTHQLITECSKDIPELAHWSNDGTYFTIAQPDIFSETCLPRFFKHGKFTSFVRQLNFYGFQKVKNAPHSSFFHVHFLRDHPEALGHIQRSTRTSSYSKTTKGRNMSSSSSSLTSTIPSLVVVQDESSMSSTTTSTTIVLHQQVQELQASIHACQTTWTKLIDQQIQRAEDQYQWHKKRVQGLWEQLVLLSSSSSSPPVPEEEEPAAHAAPPTTPRARTDSIVTPSVSPANTPPITTSLSPLETLSGIASAALQHNNNNNQATFLPIAHLRPVC